MNYPIWEVGFGSGLLIAAVATIHVFISHFAVGGGLFLVLTERRARRTGDTGLLGWLKFHTKFFVLVTVVLGVVTGVGIWFTIGLISPVATSNLIHVYVWGWAIEWVFFFVEITAALLYLYSWEKAGARLHQWYGWIYFIAAYASLVVINGIITFMLTSGRWVDTRQFWSGFFNPTYFPSLAVRSAIAMALAGIYALITASVQRDSELKSRIVRWSARWIVPSLAVLPALVWWYIRMVPSDVWASARGPMPTATHFALYAEVLLASTFALFLVALLMPARMHLAFSLLIAGVAFGAMSSFEFTREAIRKPYIIGNYLYANSLYAAPMPGDGGFNVDHINEAGILKTAKWLRIRDVTMDDQVAAGREVFRLECSSCHSVDTYRSVRKYLALRQWGHEKLLTMLGSLDGMHNSVMPPFAGTDSEREALAAFLGSVQPVAPAMAATDGETVFVQNCAMCHELRPEDSVFAKMPRDPKAADNALKRLPGMFTLMPDIKLSDDERAALVRWVVERNNAGSTKPEKGGN